MKPREFAWTHINNQDELETFYKSILPNIKEAAKQCGYAVGVHGSLRRDLDLIAVPWVETSSDKDVLARAIHKAACGLESASYEWEKKPSGRVATSFPVCWTWHNKPMILSNGHIDLSVMHERNQDASIARLMEMLAIAKDGLNCSCYCDDGEYIGPKPCGACNTLESIAALEQNGVEG